MKWNTKPFTNIDDDTFVGRYNGVDFRVKPGETRYFPSEVSNHLGQQLVKIVADKEMKRENKKSYDKGPLIDQIIGAEIKTANEMTALTFKKQVELHEEEYQKRLDEEKKQELFKKEKALKIAGKASDSTAGGLPRAEESSTAN